MAPIILPKKDNRDEFLNQDFNKEHIEKCFEADVVLLAVRDISDHSIIVKYSLKEIETQSLLDADAIGNVLCHFMEIDGKNVDHPLNSRFTGIGVDVSKNIPNKL